MPDPITKKVRDSLKRVKVRKKIVRDSTSRMEMVNVLKKELGKENYNKIRTNKVKDVKLSLKQKKYISRINQLAKKENISRETIARMSAFQRHKKNAEVGAENKATPWKDAGYVAWLGWGGTSGINWASKKLEQIDKK